MVEYRHVQTGHFLFLVYGILIPIAVVLVIVTGFNTIFIIALILLLIALCMFASLSVTVNDRFIIVEFFLGFPRKVFSLDQVIAYRSVKSPWYYGWGVRYTPRGWLFRVSGLSAIEIELINGKRYQIGTDEPETLSKAIGQVLNIDSQ